MANNAHGYPGPSTPRAEGDLTRPALSGSARIVTQLRRAILDGGYGFRERVPSERELATEYGAARGTVRTALKQLEDMNLVIRRPGSGTFVRYRGHADEEDIAEQTSPLELIEVRLSVEPSVARLAVLHANAQDMERMGEALLRVEACRGDPDAFSRADETFHLALAESTRNPLMVWLYRHINDVRGHAQWSVRKDKILTSERIAEYNKQHRALFAAIESRDTQGAVSIMTEHLEKARGDLLGTG
ncbi:MAG: FCD domain-containing protein [Gammaproteobacteria bacterium]|jgi:DNA-binding FadR family transcriptional regulator|nr:FCD domain-containing protein [Gammaproteobacteria bacterium]NCF83407.1 FCD domain-containing protein [Pseudomonadota bacterium]